MTRPFSLPWQVNGTAPRGHLGEQAGVGRVAGHTGPAGAGHDVGAQLTQAAQDARVGAYGNEHPQPPPRRPGR